MGMDQNRTQALSNDPNRTQLGAPPVADPNKTMMGTAPSLNATITIKPVQCPVCKTFNPAGVMFCNECGLIFDRALDGDAFGAPAIQLPVFVDANGREHPIRPGQNTVGREGVDISLGDAKVSRRHALIISEDGKFWIEDVGSTNGTQINGKSLTVGIREEVQSGDKVSFGGFEGQIRLPGGASASATQSVPSTRTAALTVQPTVQETGVAYLVGNGQRYALQKGQNTFGRRAENAVCIADPYVSGRHGVIEITDEGIFLTDVGSTNGTIINDAKLTPNMRTLFTPEDVLKLGSLEFRLEMA